MSAQPSLSPSGQPCFVPSVDVPDWLGQESPIVPATYGRIGIKCWICRGEVYGKRDLSPVPPQKKDRGDRRGGAPGRRRAPRS